MLHTDSFNLKRVPLIFLLIFGVCWKHCAAQVNREEENEPPDGHGGGAFFALRSCHRLLHGGDSGEFFSPDYLCSNPSLWCNWTVRVDPGKRIHLHLEDLTPDDTCHLKQDEIHVDDPAARSGGHKVLQKCWREAKYTSSSDTLQVVLLIGGWPHLPYRGFYGRYQAFGPPVMYNPQDVSESEPGLAPELDGEQMESDSSEHPPTAHSDVFDYYDSAMTAELPWGPEGPEEAADTDAEFGENLHPASGNYSHVNPSLAEPTAPSSTQGTSRWGRGVAHTPSGLSDSAVHPESPQQQLQEDDRQNRELKPTDRSDRSGAAVRRNVEEASARPEDDRDEQNRSEVVKPAAGSDGENRTEVGEASDQRPSSSEGPEPGETEQTHPHPNMVEPLSDHRGNLNVKNHSEIPHLPGDHLFEAAVEVNFSQDLEEPWDNLARSLLLSVKASISEQLEALHTPLSMSSKRIKRLNAGVLYILWLQIGQGPGSQQVHRAVHAAMQGLIATSVGLRGTHSKAVIVSVSTADVNECGTQLVLCDVNAECVNQFGSYSCRCRPGFLDRSRLGSGGTVCMDVAAAGCGSGLSAETKGIYVLFFLLSSLILMLLVAAGTLYRRHHRGMFLVRCHSSSSVSPPDPNNNQHHHHDGYSSPHDSDLPPPPPPARGPREGWPQVKERCPAMDLPLLRFSPLLPPDGYLEPREGGKM
uniref:CUB domain-containing protein n=1 Tax=Seriola dumerili TaxID=41447 RepID=A0A3B4V1J4_SERDU